jgi:DNA-binding transcriptional ArsR family regulator
MDAELTYSYMAIQQQAQLDSIFHALADETRRGMLALLARSDRTAGELGDPFEISQPSCSKHIAVLEHAGLVKRTVEGRVHRFRLQSRPLRDSEAWITRHRQLWEGSLERLDTLLTHLQKGGSK